MSDSYYRNVNPELLGWLPLDAKRVLELGCGEAALGAVYKTRNPTAHYTAIEIHAPSAAVARTRLDRVIEGNVEALTDEDIAQGDRFDVAIMGDVLEHLSDPWQTLKRLHGLLDDNGHLVVCVPNIAHWSALAELMSGRWPARDSGLFDRTHLRFFTLDSLTTILGEVGFQVLKVRPRNFPLDRAAAERVIPVLADTAERLGSDRRAFVARANALQYVLVAQKASAPPPQMLRMHIAAMAPRFLDTRTRLPAEALSSLPDLSVSMAEKSLNLPNLPAGLPKICVIQRVAVQNEDQFKAWVAKQIREGWILVAESDDHPSLLAAVHGRDPAKESWLSITAAHAVQTSTPGLADAFRAHNPIVACFPNAAFSLQPFRKRSGPMRVFMGALNRERVTAGVAQALTTFCANYRDVEFVVMHDRAFFEGLATDQKIFLPASSYAAYLEAMDGCHVALMPLEGTYGETFKSDVKFVEASSCGVVSIASPTVYEKSISDGKTGLIAREIGDWAKHLTKLYQDEALRDGLAYNAWSQVRQSRMFAHQIDDRKDWYRSLWDRRDEHNAALLKRHPELS